MSMEVPEKKCKMCEIVYPISNFYKSGVNCEGKLTYRGCCKSCDKIKNKQYKRDKENIAVIYKRYTQNNRDIVNARHRDYYERHKEQKRAYLRQRYHASKLKKAQQLTVDTTILVT